MDDAQNSKAPSELIITRSFNGLMDRVAKIDYFDVWYEWSKAKKAAKKQKREPTIRMSQVFTLTGLQREDLELFTLAIPLIDIVESGDDPLLSFEQVFCLVKIFERLVEDGVMSSFSVDDKANRLSTGLATCASHK